MISSAEIATRASDGNLRDAAEMHRRIYQAIRGRDPAAARAAMNEHLQLAAAHQAKEVQNSESPPRRRLRGRLAPPLAAPAEAVVSRRRPSSQDRQFARSQDCLPPPRLPAHGFLALGLSPNIM